jgi:hypothetical protein
MKRAQKAREHSIFLSKNQSDFAQRFSTEVGESFEDFAANITNFEDLQAIILTGSIPLGVGSPRSDIDFLFLTLGREEPRLSTARSGNQLLFAGRPAGGEANLSYYESIILAKGIEIGINFIDIEELRRTGAALAGGGSYLTLTGPATMILSRVKTGWCLWQREPLSQLCGELVDNDALEIHSSARYMSFALQDLEDAEAAIEQNPQLALFLGRLSVEKSFMSYFASRGVAFAGSKWLRLLHSDRFDIASDKHVDLRLSGTNLLFPVATNNPDDLATYLENVKGFIAQLQKSIFSLPALAIAFKMSAQLYDPTVKRV